jgi:hypothetical protein
MAVAVQMEFEGVTLEQYDAILEKMGYMHDGEGAPGGVFHWVAQTGRGLHIVDVWESKDAFERFAREELGPYTQELGIEQPQMTFFEVYNTLRAPEPVA